MVEAELAALRAEYFATKDDFDSRLCKLEDRAERTGQHELAKTKEALAEMERKQTERQEREREEKVEADKEKAKAVAEAEKERTKARRELLKGVILLVIGAAVSQVMMRLQGCGRPAGAAVSAPVVESPAALAASSSAFPRGHAR